MSLPRGVPKTVHEACPENSAEWSDYRPVYGAAGVPFADRDCFSMLSPKLQGMPAIQIPRTVDYFYGGGYNGSMGAEENSFTCALFRGACRYAWTLAPEKSKPMLTMAAQNNGSNTDIGIRLGVYAGLIQGIKGLRYFRYGPQYADAHDYFSDSLARMMTLNEIGAEIREVDEALYRGRVRPSRIAIVFSHTDDIWNEIMIADETGPIEEEGVWASNVFAMERRSLFFSSPCDTLDTAVDMISEDYIRDGWLDYGIYDILYLCASHLHEHAAVELSRYAVEGRPMGIAFKRGSFACDLG